MTLPWGSAGPEFLLLYGIAVGLAGGVAAFLRWVARRPRVGKTTTPMDGDLLVAYLVGKAGRVVETSLARLVHRGAVRVSRDGVVSATTCEVPDLLDQAVLRKIGTEPRPVYQVVERARCVAEIDEVAKTAAERRLEISLDDAESASNRALIAPYVVLAIGAVRFAVSLPQDFPSLFLLVELWATGLMIGGLDTSGIREVTVHGTRLIAAARKSGGFPTMVALDGVAAYPDKEIAAALGVTRYER